MTRSLLRITARVDVETQNLLSQAAAIAGVSSLNAFVVSAAIEKAQQIIERDQILKLSQRDAMMVVEALDAPAKVHSRLQQAAHRYDSKSQS